MLHAPANGKGEYFKLLSVGGSNFKSCAINRLSKPCPIRCSNQHINLKKGNLFMHLYADVNVRGLGF